MENSTEQTTLDTIRGLMKCHNSFLAEIANLVVQSALNHLDTVDSKVLVEVLERNNKQFTEICKVLL